MVDETSTSVAPIGLYTDTPKTPEISFDNANPTPPVDPSVAQDRAVKYDFALGDKSPGVDAIKGSIAAGTENPLRMQAVADKTLEDENHRLSIIQQIAQMRQGPLSQDEMDVIRGLKPDPQKRDPDTILEQEYGRKFWNTVLTVSPMMDPLLRDMAKKNEDYLLWLTDTSSDIKAKQETTLRLTQDYEAKYKDTGWLPAIGRELLAMVPGYDVYNAQRTLPNVAGENFFPGSAMRQKLQNLHLMNPSDYNKVLTAEMEKLWAVNPTQAMHFLHNVQSYSTSDAFFADAFSLLNLSQTAGSVVAKGATTLGRASLDAARALDTATAAARGMTAQELKAASMGTAILTGQDRAARTVRTPRSMDQAELIRAGQGVNGDPFPQSFTPDSIRQMGVNLQPKTGNIGTAEEPRFMSIRELEAVAGDKEAGRFFTSGEVSDMATRLQTARAYIDILKAGTGPRPDAAKVLAGAGDIGPSATLQAAREVLENMKGQPGLANFADRAQSILNPVGRLDDATSLSAEATKRHSLNWSQNAKLLLSAITDPVLVRRMPDTAVVAALKSAETKWAANYKGPNDAILDIRWNLGRAPEDLKNFAPKLEGKNLSVGNIFNENSVSYILGRKDGTLFESKANAEFTANLQYRLGKGTYAVEQQGGGWYIRANKAVDETAPNVRDQLLQTEMQVPKSWQNMFLGMLRSSKDVTSLLNSESRNLVTHGSQAIQAVMKELAAPIGTLSRQEFKNMKRFFALDRDWQGPDKIPGRFLDTVGQFETEYSNVFKTLPSDKEVAAYFAYRQLNDFDYLVRNLGFYRDLSRQGVENVRFRWADRTTGDKIWSDYFLAKQVGTLPTKPNDAAAGIYIFDSTTGKGKTLRTGKLTKQHLDDIKAKLDDGYKVYQIANPLDRPLKTQAGVNDYVNYILVKDSNTKGLNWDMIPYKAGGHREYAQQWFVKQADVAKMGGRVNYQGDKTLLGQYTEAEANRYTAALNKARELYLAKSPDFDSHVSSNLPAEWGPKELRKKFASNEWNASEPFHTTFTGQTVKDVDHTGLAARYGDKFHDEMNSPHNLFANVDKKFVGSRDPALKTMIEQGSEDAPQLQLGEAPLIDPLRSLNRTVSNVVHQRMISDYKWQSVEGFIANHAHVLDVPLDTLRQSPLYWAMNPLKFRPGMAEVDKAAAKADQAAIKSFLGMDSPDVRAIKWMQMKALDGVYNTLGQGVSNYVAEHMLSTVADPTKYARNLAFHSKLGLFNPVQYLNQLQTLTHVAALAGPVNGGKALAASTLMTMLRFTENPAIIDHFAQISTKFGWEADQFKHAYEQLRRSGWNRVQGETSWRDDVADPNMFKSGWGKFLDAGTVFFTEGEKLTRMTAWNASYLEHMAGKRIGQFNDQTLQKVLSRADLMNVNMTRASQSPLQQGLVGTATQFLTYQQRLFEQMWGSRLTQVEKARVLATYSAMYGVPVASGVAVGVWPMYDSMRTSALERGQNWDNSWAKGAMEGLPSLAIKAITGKDTNFAERFGPQGVTALSDVLTGEKPWWTLFAGVSGSTLVDMTKAMSPVMGSLWMAVTGRSEQFPVVLEDLTDAASTITTANNALKAAYMWNYGKYLTKAGVPIADGDKTDAVLTAAFGLTRRDTADSFRERRSLKLLKQAQDSMSVNVATEMRRALDAASQNDENAAQRHVARAQQFFRMGDLRPEQWGQILKQASRPGDQIDNIRFDFFFKKAPASQLEDRQKELGVGR